MNIAIIGGGMSGIVASIYLARQGHQITLIEQNARLGRKISMSGNGRCNISNDKIDESYYNDSALVRSVLSSVDSHSVLQFVHSCNIVTYSDSSGRIYPITDNANSVVDCLRNQLELLTVKVLLECRAISVIGQADTGYTLTLQDDKTLRSDCIIVACGSPSSASMPNYHQLIGADRMTQLVPSLTPIATRYPDRSLNGIRAKVVATLLQDGQPIADSNGEVLFKDYGLSGICIFDLSAIIARQVKQHTDIATFSIALDLLPMFSMQELTKELQQRYKVDATTNNLLLGLLHNKLASHIINGATEPLDVCRLAYAIKNDTHSVAKLLGFDMSQVTCGGIDSKLVDGNLQLSNGIYCIGECLDVDGTCGGYNLHWAIASALCVGKVI